MLSQRWNSVGQSVGERESRVGGARRELRGNRRRTVGGVLRSGLARPITGDDLPDRRSAGPRRPPRPELSAYRFHHERADPCLFGGSQLLQREGDGPHSTFVEIRLVTEAERRVPGVELLRALEEADDLAVLSICGHSVPESRREGWHACFDDSMEPLAHDAFRFRHLADLREDGVFPVRLVRARAAARRRLQLLDALLHRDSFLVRESLELLADRGSALGGLLRFLLWAHRNILILI